MAPQSLTRLPRDESLVTRQELLNHSGSLDALSGFVSRNKGKTVGLPDARLRVCDLGGTVYAGEERTLEFWENLYLPSPERMRVLGAVDDFPCLAPAEQLVILVGEGGAVYAFEEDELHELAPTVASFLQVGLRRFGLKAYRMDEPAEYPSEEELMKNPRIREIREETRAFVTREGEQLRQLLDSIL